MGDVAMIRFRLAEWILACVAAPADRGPAIGDLAEEYELRLRSGSALRAGWWYWSQVLRSVPWLAWTPVRRSGLFATLLVALAACACQAGLELGIRSVMAHLPSTSGDARLLVASIVVLASMAAVSFACARIRPGASSVLTLVALTAVALQLLLRNGAGLSVAQQFVAIVAPPSAACLGGALSWRVRPS
jgi:hypothetical protein